MLLPLNFVKLKRKIKKAFDLFLLSDKYILYKAGERVFAEA